MGFAKLWLKLGAVRRFFGGGGLVTIWDNKVIREEEVVKSQRILVIKVRSLGDDFPSAIANVYSPNVDGDRAPFSLHLRHLISMAHPLVHRG